MHREGLFNAVLTTVNVLLAGILTFEFWEPLANLLDEKFQEGSLARLEDAIVMVSLFAVFLIALRWTLNSLSPTAIELEPNLDLYGGAAVGIFAGYLLAGFLVCVMETLPWKADFLGFTPHSTDDKARRYFPPDGVLAGPHAMGRDQIALVEAGRSRKDILQHVRAALPALSPLHGGGRPTGAAADQQERVENEERKEKTRMSPRLKLPTHIGRVTDRFRD